jgi:hypothetical protein
MKQYKADYDEIPYAPSCRLTDAEAASWRKRDKEIDERAAEACVRKAVKRHHCSRKRAREIIAHTRY